MERSASQHLLLLYLKDNNVTTIIQINLNNFNVIDNIKLVYLFYLLFYGVYWTSLVTITDTVNCSVP